MASTDAFRPLRKRAAAWLADVSAITSCTDESLVAYLQRLSGARIDRSTLANYRGGRRGAPLELLFAVLNHCDQDERRAVLNLLARPFGLRVVEEEAEAARDLVGAAIEATTTTSKLLQTAHAALADGRLDDDERNELTTLAGELAEVAETIRARVRRGDQ